MENNLFLGTYILCSKGVIMSPAFLQVVQGKNYTHTHMPYMYICYICLHIFYTLMYLHINVCVYR